MSDDAPPVKQQMVSAAIQEMRAVDEVLELAENERLNGGVTGEMRRLTQARVYAYYRSVKRCVDMFPQAEDKWDDHGVGRFEELRQERHPVTQRQAGRGTKSEVQEITAPLPFEELDTISDELDDVTAHLAEHTAGLNEAVV
jgi:hypothetical protein